MPCQPAAVCTGRAHCSVCRSPAVGSHPRRRQIQSAASGESDSGTLPPLPAAVTEELKKQPIRKPAFYKGLERPIGAFGAEWHPLFALLIFFLGFFNHLTFDSFTLFKVSAVSKSPTTCICTKHHHPSLQLLPTPIKHTAGDVCSA